jgi:regulator of sigma E protease
VSFVAAILGLAVLILVHEAGHFVAARAVGMRPRKFYLGFGPPIAKTTRGGVEYGIGSIPLGGYVKIPGMHRPAAGDLRRSLPPDEQQQLHEHLARLDDAIQRGDEDAARIRLGELEPHVGRTRAYEELDGALAPEAYWRQKTWKRIVVIAAGPGVNVAVAIVIFCALFMLGTTQATRTVEKVLPGKPAAAAGLARGDRIVAVAGHAVGPKQIARHINGTHGRPFTIVVRRAGHRVTVGPLRAKLDHGVYRVGFQIRGVPGPGESPPRALWSSLKVVGAVTADTGRTVGRLVTGTGSREISSSVGIVRVSSDAFKQSIQDFLSVLGLISLALALLNLLPVLPLDGGHIVMSVAERIRGRAFSQDVYMRFAAVGFALFALLMYFGLRNDLFGNGG